jgi:hypothetical protein
MKRYQVNKLARYMATIFICLYGFIMFCMVFHVLNATFIGISLKSSVILFVSFRMYVKVAYFVLWCCGSVFSFWFCVVRCFLTQFTSHLLFCSVFFMTFSSFLLSPLLLDMYAIHLIGNT